MKNHAHSTAREGFIDIQPNPTRTMYCRIKGGGKMQNKRRYTIVAIAVAVLFLFSVILTVGVDTDWGRVEVTHMVVTTADGDEVNCLLYKPSTATPENPAPCVLLAHGGNDMMEQCTSYALELARRGYVCISRDAMGNHNSDIPTGTAETATVEAAGYRPSGLDAVLHQVRLYNFVDQNKIVAIGHSLGGTNTIALSIKHQQGIFLSINLGQNMYGREWNQDYNFNYDVIIGIADESCLAHSDPQNYTINSLETVQLRRIFFGDYTTPDEELPMIELGKVYTAVGTDGKEYHRTAFQPDSTHAYYLCTNDAVQTVVYAITSECGLGLDAGVNSYADHGKIHTVWQWHDVGYFLIYVSVIAIMFVVAFGLINSRVFADLRLNKPAQPLGIPKKNPLWWIFAIVLAAVPMLLYKPGVIASTGKWLGIPVRGLWLCGGNSNGFITWQWYVSLAMIAIFLIYHFVWGRRHGGSLHAYGLATSNEKGFHIHYVLKALAFGLLTVGAGYLAFMTASAYTKGGIHIGTFMMSTVSPKRTLAIFMYFLFQIPYFLLGNLAFRSVGLTEFEDSRKGTIKSIALGTLLTVGVIFVFWAYFVIQLSTTHMLTPYFLADRMYIYGILALPLVLGMSVANALNLYVSKKTNSLWTGLFTALLFGTWVIICCGEITKYVYW